MTETAFHVETEKDFMALVAELGKFGREFGGADVAGYWRVYFEDTVVYATTEDKQLLYAKKEYFYRKNPEAYLPVFTEGMRIAVDDTGFHIDNTTFTLKDSAKATPKNIVAVSDSIQDMMGEYGVMTVAAGIEQWMVRNGFSDTSPEPEPEPEAPKYTVKLPNPYSTANYMLKRNDEGAVIIQRLSLPQCNADYTKLTEDEIRKDFDWAWQFAEEVK